MSGEEAIKRRRRRALIEKAASAHEHIAEALAAVRAGRGPDELLPIVDMARDELTNLRALLIQQRKAAK